MTVQKAITVVRETETLLHFLVATFGKGQVHLPNVLRLLARLKTLAEALESMPSDALLGD
jgi:hypothetical protein